MTGCPPTIDRRLYDDADRARSLAVMLECVPAEAPIWVFAYGSLLWKPGFEPAEQQVATVNGWHRALNIHAVADRGSRERPGLWFGLESGGSVDGMALRVAPGEREAVLAYLWRREMPDDAYVPRWVACSLPDGREVTAIAFVANKVSGLYAGELAPSTIAAIMREAAGALGRASCYLVRTRAALHRLGLVDTGVEAVYSQLRASSPRCAGRPCEYLV